MEQLFKTELEDVEINIHPSNLQETIYGANAEIDFNISLDVRSYGIKDASIEIQRISGSYILAHEDDAIGSSDMSYIYDINTQSLSLHNEDSSEWEVYNNVCVVFEIEDGNEDFRIVIREIIIDIEKGGSTITVNL